jgi:spore coat polysaccharide biosynthesis protein SpsF
MSSSRLPGKVLADIEGRPALLRLIDRLRRADMLDDIVVATTDRPSDDPLARLLEVEGVACFRGSEDDVLDRVIKAHRIMKSDLIVEVTGDCTLIDPTVIDLGVTTYLENDVDLVANVVKPSFPMGIDVQVFPFEMLADVEANVKDAAVREHVSLFFYEHPERYRILHLDAPVGYYAPEQRLQLDYPEDLQLIRELYRRLGSGSDRHFGTPEILQLLAAEPSLVAINRHCVEKPTR